VVVMSSAPGRIKQIFEVKLPEVRDRFAAEFTHYESEITRVVKEEVLRHLTATGGQGSVHG
jgi:ABC-type nitrate/sulfonate/bicarbonate transport system ATPase subunit